MQKNKKRSSRQNKYSGGKMRPLVLTLIFVIFGGLIVYQLIDRVERDNQNTSFSNPSSQNKISNADKIMILNTLVKASTPDSKEMALVSKKLTKQEKLQKPVTKDELRNRAEFLSKK
jgi:hypothetical protein